MRRFFGRLRDSFARFMIGRNGVDDMGQFMSGTAIVLLVVSLLFSLLFNGGWFSTVLYYIAFILLIWTYIRMFSKKLDKRYQQNQRFLERRRRFQSNRYVRSVRTSYARTRDHMKQRRTYKFFKCPNCKQKMRTRKGQGEKVIVCPKCHTQFTKKT